MKGLIEINTHLSPNQTYMFSHVFRTLFELNDVYLLFIFNLFCSILHALWFHMFVEVKALP